MIMVLWRKTDGNYMCVKRTHDAIITPLWRYFCAGLSARSRSRRTVVGLTLVVLPVNILRCFECCIGKQLCDFYGPVNLIAWMGANFKHDCTGTLSDLSVLQTKMADVPSKMVGELCIVCFSGSIELYLVKTWLHSVHKLWNYSNCGGTVSHNRWWLFSMPFRVKWVNVGHWEMSDKKVHGRFPGYARNIPIVQLASCSTSTYPECFIFSCISCWFYMRNALTWFKVWICKTERTSKLENPTSAVGVKSDNCGVMSDTDVLGTYWLNIGCMKSDFCGEKIQKICASKWLNLLFFSIYLPTSWWRLYPKFRKYLNLTVPVRLYPKQCPTLPHVSPKFPRGTSDGAVNFPLKMHRLLTSCYNTHGGQNSGSGTTGSTHCLQKFWEPRLNRVILESVISGALL